MFNICLQGLTCSPLQVKYSVTLSFFFSSTPDNEYLHKSGGSVFLYNVPTGKSSEFLSKATFDEKNAYDYQLSADHKFVAFMSNYSKLWRHSFTASYSLYDLTSKCVSFCSLKYLFVQAYVWRNNVYIISSPGSKPVQVTFTGEENLLLNGIPDWVYEEEMFSSGQGFWWSPEGKYVAFAEFNDTKVHTIEYSWFGDNQYPSTVIIPYPKPGTPNPIVKLFVVDADNVENINEVVVPATFSSVEHYLASVTWATENRVAVQWLKREQNHLILQIYNFTGTNWAPDEVKPEVMDKYCCFHYIRANTLPFKIFAADKNSYYLLMSDTTKYKHIHHVVGVGISVVFMPASFSPKSKIISLYGGRPGGRNVYKWSSQGTVCLTCTLRKNCHYNSAYFSHDASYYRMSCSGQFYFSDLSSRIFTFVEINVLEDNGEFKGNTADIQMPTMRRGTVKVAGYTLWYQMFLPPGFKESKKYPLLIDVYAGPCSQTADYAYTVNWATYLASTENIIVASFDGRGSGYQGDTLMHEIYKRLGTYEVEDQITATREFIKMGFIDKDRVAIWGWSYGGYVTSMVLGSGSGVFKCGMAVAPVSKWEFYDSIYTERYMLEPSKNLLAYTNSTVMERAKNFHSVQYLLIHGTADDNVHFQQAAEISEALVEEQVDFEAMWYTDKDHGLPGAANRHVYTHMSHFLQRCFA
uniref:Dipeptidyl-peptidase 4 n=1 Tax=Amphiprion ocellaris TaxID=80972 RepID=A0AAQ6A7M2_AMPOC